MANSDLEDEEDLGKLLVKKEEYLIRNGASLFKELAKSTHGKNNPFRIFSLEELQKATNNFSADPILRDYFSDTCTYRGVIEGRRVAVKIHRVGRHTLVEISKEISLSLIFPWWHKNVVKLLGCCLETNFPIVVHEHLIDNDANLFKELVKYSHGKNNSFRIFSLKELQKATNNFSADQILNGYSFHHTYRGTIEDRDVAVKISGINEVVSLSLIKHRNVVKLMGCCFETEDPIVVHELPLKGILEENIFHWTKPPPSVEVSWTDRLRIATEIADALAYLLLELHMTHGHLWDAKAVLLDEFHSAKLSTFDFSKIQSQAESSDVETDILNKFFKRGDVFQFGNILLNLLGIELGEVEERCDKVEILKYVKLNVSEKEMPQIEAYIHLLLRCLSSHEQRSNILSVDQYYERIKEVVGEDKVPSKEKVVRKLRGIRRRRKMNRQPATDGNESDNLHQLNMHEKEMLDLLLRCQSSDEVAKRVPSMEEVARELRRIRSM